MQIGCHVSIAGGIANAPGRAKDLGCEAFQIFTRSPQGGKANPITDQVVSDFKSEMQKRGLNQFVAHAPYFINMGSAAKNIYYGSISVLRDELERSSLLGARYLMTHLGTYRDIGEEKGAEQVVAGLVKVLNGYKGSTKFLIEIAAGSGSIIGSTFEQLARFSNDLQTYPGFGGICFDTQHAFASGYAIHDQQGVKNVFEDFDKLIGLDWLRMSQVNDSKIELGGKRDRHDHIGEGKIGESGFNDFLKFWNDFESKSGEEKPLILETEHDKVIEDIIKLKQIRKQVTGI